jgi:hypothetical protein
MRVKKIKGRKVLSIDWDWVTGDCTPGCMHSHCGWCLQYNDTVKGPCVRGKKSLFDKGRFDRRGKILVRTLERLFNKKNKPEYVYVAECHADIMQILKIGDEVWSIDAHSDNSDTDSLCCGSWEYACPYLNIEVHNHTHDYVSQEWCIGSVFGRRRRVEGPDEEVKRFNKAVDVVFLCRSSPFTPKDFDPHFFELCCSMGGYVSDFDFDNFIGYKREELYSLYLKQAGL